MPHLPHSKHLHLLDSWHVPLRYVVGGLIHPAAGMPSGYHPLPMQKTGKKGRPSALDAASTESCERTSAPPQKKPAKEYVPAIGSANYAFLIVMYQVGGLPTWCQEMTPQNPRLRGRALCHRGRLPVPSLWQCRCPEPPIQAAVGPEQLCELTKSELMERAERSGLADRPIIGDGEGLAEGVLAGSEEMMLAHSKAGTRAKPEQVC